MEIQLSKFGEVLTSRPAGKEAFAAIRPTLDPQTKEIEIGFDGVLSLSPSWADEFFRALEDLYGSDNISFIQSDNPSVNATLKILYNKEG